MTPRLAASCARRASQRLAALIAVVALASATPALADTAASAPTPSTPSASGSGGPAGVSNKAAAPRQNATFGIQPVTNGRTDSRTAFTYQTGPGGAYQDAFAVVNYGARPLQLQVYAADLTNDSDGGLSVGSATDKLVGAATWLRLPNGLKSVRVPGVSTKTGPGLVRVPFGWAVPAGAAAGDHTAAIVVSLSVLSTGKNGQPVRLDQRVASRVFFRVSGAIKPQLSVTDLNVDYDGVWNPVGSGTAQVTYTLTNTGNVRLGAKQQLTSSAWLGAGGTPTAIADQPMLLPGASVHVTTAVRNVFPGLRLTEKVHIVAVRAVDDVNVKPGAVDAQTTTLAIPWTLVFSVVALLVLLGLALWWRRRRIRRRPPGGGSHRRRGGPAPTPTDRGGDSVTEPVVSEVKA